MRGKEGAREREIEGKEERVGDERRREGPRSRKGERRRERAGRGKREWSQLTVS